MSNIKNYNIPRLGHIKMMNLDNYYLHATGGVYGRHIEHMSILSILKDQELKTRDSRGASANLYNYDDELCLWDPQIKFSMLDKVRYFSSVDIFITHSPSLVLSRNLEIFKPKLNTVFQKETKETILGATNIYDEVRYKGNINTENIEFITFPIFKPKKMSVSRAELNIFSKEIKMIHNIFPTLKIKDLFTGKDLNAEIVDEKINEMDCKYMRKELLLHPFRW